LGQPEEKVLPIALAVEMIHTYSLIHDDLPVMDNDDIRRGQLTNHKVYGDALALLAGDGLLTMAFEVLAQAKQGKVVEAIAQLARAAGPGGMVGGQVMDIQAAKNMSVEQLQKIHELKTGALIAVSVRGAALLCDADAKQILALEKFGNTLGFAFQLADDVQDHDADQPEAVSFTSLLGMGKTVELLMHASEQAIAALEPFGAAAQPLREMVLLNQSRI
jgi:geranylgeranyl diphosphate synthase, type II